MTPVKADDEVALISSMLKNEYVGALRDGDVERWMALWIPAGKQMVPNAPARLGLDQIREGNRPLMELFNTEMTVFPDEIRVLGNYAYTHGNYDYSMTPKEGGQTIKGHGKFLTILHKQPDGAWRIAIDCFNDNAPPNAK